MLQVRGSRRCLLSIMASSYCFFCWFVTHSDSSFLLLLLFLKRSIVYSFVDWGFTCFNRGSFGLPFVIPQVV